MLEKAGNLKADALVFDLEDSVPMAEKEVARRMVANTLQGLPASINYVRVNSITSGLTSADLEGIVGPNLVGILLPKAESTEEIHELEAMLSQTEMSRGLKPGSLQIITTVESAKGVVNAPALATASRRVRGLFFGSEDYARDMGIERTKEGIELLYPRSAVAIAAAAAAVQPIDHVYADFQDLEGLQRDAKTGRQMGYKGKGIIHPSQIEPVHMVFSPSAEEVAYAQRVVEAFEAAQAQGLASISLEGKMIDVAIADRAKALLVWARVLAAREARSGS